jgi:hypothetical protein
VNDQKIALSLIGPDVARLAGALVATMLTVVLVLTLVLPGCSSRPDDPAYDNPLDPQGPHGGDPFNVSAEASGNNVLVRWTQPAHPDVVAYVILHSLNGQSFSVAGEADHLAGAEVNNFLHESAAPNADNWYKVQALSSAGLASASTAVRAVRIETPPYLTIDGGVADTPTRFVTLAIRTSAGDSLVIADNDTFTNATVLAVAPDDTTFVDWDLGPAAENGETKDVYVKVQTGPLFSLPANQSLTIRFNPRFSIVGDENGVADQVVDLEVSTVTALVVAAGVDSMRFAASEAELASTDWAVGTTIYNGYILVDNPGTQTIHGEFLSDFGFTAVATYEAVPDDLSDASFTVESLTGDPDLTENGVVRLVSLVGALEMRHGESPSFVGVPWEAYADTVIDTLSAGEGLKVIYVQFRNFWAQSPVVSDWITRVTQELEVGFLAPQNGAVVLGGTTLLVEGLAVPATGYDVVDLVEVDLGDGFQTASGTERWSLGWDIPFYTADTPLTLRARASIGDSVTATTAITVTVTQLAVAISEPAEGAMLTGGSVVPVNGTATALLNGAPLDSVVVGLAGRDTVATGLESWSVDWAVPGVTENLEVLITATAWAGGEASPPDTVTVTITP